MIIKFGDTLFVAGADLVNKKGYRPIAIVNY